MTELFQHIYWQCGGVRLAPISIVSHLLRGQCLAQHWYLHESNVWIIQLMALGTLPLQSFQYYMRKIFRKDICRHLMEEEKRFNCKYACSHNVEQMRAVSSAEFLFFYFRTQQYKCMCSFIITGDTIHYNFDSCAPHTMMMMTFPILYALCAHTTLC